MPAPPRDTDDSTIAPGSTEPTYFEAETFAAGAYSEPTPGISEVGASDAGLADAGDAGADTSSADDTGNVDQPTRQVDMTALFDAEAAESGHPRRARGNRRPRRPTSPNW